MHALKIYEQLVKTNLYLWEKVLKQLHFVGVYCNTGFAKLFPSLQNIRKIILITFKKIKITPLFPQQLYISYYYVKDQVTIRRNRDGFQVHKQMHIVTACACSQERTTTYGTLWKFPTDYIRRPDSSHFIMRLTIS